MLDAKVPREAYRTIARCAPVRRRASLGRSRRYSLAGLNTLTTHVEPASVTASDAPPWFQRILPCAAARGTTASVDPLPYGPRRRSTRSSVSNRAAFPRARDTLLASSRATRRSGQFALFRPNVRPPARTTCSTQSRIPSYAACPWRRNDPLSDTETPATTDSCEVTPVPFSAHSGVGSDSCFAGSSLSCPLRNIEDTGDGERSEALSTIAFAMRMQELVASTPRVSSAPTAMPKLVARLGRRSTIVGLPPSAVPNFAKSLIVVARRGFSDAA